MYLAKAKAHRAPQTVAKGHCGDSVTLPLPGGRWQNFPNSQISHHGASCCDIAREWLIAFDFAQLNGGDKLSGPRWMREHSSWGPTVWPIHWCEAVDAKVVDCGVHAAIAHEAFTARGVPAFRAQFIQRYDPDSTGAWSESWGKHGASAHWIDGDAIYHEGNAVVTGGNRIKLWDGSAGCWINSRNEVGYGSLIALRIELPLKEPLQVLVWNGREIQPNSWVSLRA
jgi:hypothetical protein